MRVAVVTETFYSFKGGSSRRYFEVFRRLARRGYEVHVYTVRLSAQWPVREELEGLSIRRTPWPLERFITPQGLRSGSQVMLYTSWLLGELGRERYDIIEANHCPLFPCLPSWLLSRSRRTPLSVTFHEVWQNHWRRYVPSSVLVPFGIALERLVARLPNLCIAVSEFTAQRMRRLLHVPGSRIEVIPNGVPVLHEAPGAEGRERGRLIYVGRLNPHKRLELLLDALLLLGQRGHELKLDVIGEGPMKPIYQAYAAKRGLNGRVSFLGALHDRELFARLSRAYVYVLPSEREGQSITTLEAMAAGTPQVVVSGDGNGAAKLVAEGRTGLVARPEPRALAEAIELLLNDEGLWRRLQRNGLSYAAAWPWDRVALLHDLAYRRLLGEA
jgi:glycosyltransferase involved in cell wall biosynthesis